MALRPSATPIKGLFRGQKRGYAVQATVKKISLDTSRPIGSVPFLFTKQGQRLRQVQQEISLRSLADAAITFQAPVANGGDAALANLETAQKIVASPKLLEQFKKDTEINKKALASAVAWLKDIRTPKEAEAASAKIDAATQALLDREIAFNQIVPLRDTLGLNLSLTQKATVAEWYVAYTAAAKLRESGKTFSTLLNASLPADVEKALHTASVARVRRQLTSDARKFVLSKLSDAPAPIKVVIGSEFSVSASTATVAENVSAAVRIINEAAATPANSSTISGIVSQLIKARNQLREVADSLRAAADAKQINAEDDAVAAAWTALYAASDKAAVETAARTIQGLKTDAVSAWDDVIQAQLPSEFASINDALTKFAAAVNALPKDLVDAELKHRQALIGQQDIPIDA